MYGVVISLILLFPWALVALATIGYLRARLVAPTRGRQQREPTDPF
jgi:hypothetical protein